MLQSLTDCLPLHTPHSLPTTIYSPLIAYHYLLLTGCLSLYTSLPCHYIMLIDYPTTTYCSPADLPLHTAHLLPTTTFWSLAAYHYIQPTDCLLLHTAHWFPTNTYCSLNAAALNSYFLLPCSVLHTAVHWHYSDIKWRMGGRALFSKMYGAPWFLKVALTVPLPSTGL